MGVLNRLYMFTSVGLLFFYGITAFNGWEFGHPQRQKLPPDARSSPGGYRSFHFWHSGYLGGK
jgi:hypothetical protein